MNKKKVKRCTGLLLNCALTKGHPGNCSPIFRSKVERSSPCASKCRHQWCAGYNVGYSDGQNDERDQRKTA